MTSLPYLLIASLYLWLFYGCYALLLSKNTFFNTNRAYLLLSVALSLVLPLVKLPVETTATLPAGIVMTLPTFVVGSTPTGGASTWAVSSWVWLVYGFGIVVMLIRLGINLRAVYRLIRRGTAEQKATYTLVQFSEGSGSSDPIQGCPIQSFSFGRYLVLNASDALAPSDALLRHEQAHIQQYHTADILFLEIMQVAFWFNPVLWLYKRALQQVHEFLADRAVLKTPQPDYPQQLVAYALHVSPTTLITPFVSQSTLKQRIIMLHKPASHRRALLGYALALPLAALLTMCTQSERDQPQSEAGQARMATPARTVKVEGKIYDLVEESPLFPGGMAKLGTYLGEHLKYPAAAEKAKAEGTVFVNFIITKDGEISDVKSLKNVGYGMDEEAIRVVTQMPRWIPAKQDGQVVNMRFNVPIRFKLDDKKESPVEKSGVETKKSAFFSFPTDDASLQLSYKHFIVNGQEVPFNKFRKYPKSAIVEASENEQFIRLETE